MRLSDCFFLGDADNPDRALKLNGHVGFDSLPDQLVNKSVAQVCLEDVLVAVVVECCCCDDVVVVVRILSLLCECSCRDAVVRMLLLL